MVVSSVVLYAASVAVAEVIAGDVFRGKYGIGDRKVGVGEYGPPALCVAYESLCTE